MARSGSRTAILGQQQSAQRHIPYKLIYLPIKQLT
jgi:hypothetical protein